MLSDGESLRAAREAAGVSMRGMARRTGISYSHLSNVERGARSVTPEIARAYRQHLAGKGNNSGGDQDVRRRDVLHKLGVVALTPALATLPDGQTIGHIGASDVHRLDEAATRLRAMGHQHGGKSLWQAAGQLVRSGYLILEHGDYSTPVGELLISTLGRAQMFAGWLAFDAGHTDSARTCFTEALTLARQADDPVIEVHALCNLAFQASIMAQPRQSLRLADTAARIAERHQTGDTRMSVVPQLRRAVAYARAGDANATSHAVGRARRLLDGHRTDDGAAWATFVSPAELDGLEATCQLYLGQSRTAETLLQQAIGGMPDQFGRNRGLYRVRLAAARLQQGEPEGAAQAALNALDDLDGQHVASRIVAAELDNVADRLARANHHSADKFLQRYEAKRARW